MATYRAYFLTPARRIVRGEWIEAATAEAAARHAAALADPGVVTVELWEGHRRVGDFACHALERPRPDAAKGAGVQPPADWPSGSGSRRQPRS
jgi:hypothetical protein